MILTHCLHRQQSGRAAAVDELPLQRRKNYGCTRLVVNPAILNWKPSRYVMDVLGY